MVNKMMKIYWSGKQKLGGKSSLMDVCLNPSNKEDYIEGYFIPTKECNIDPNEMFGWLGKEILELDGESTHPVNVFALKFLMSMFIMYKEDAELFKKKYWDLVKEICVK